MERRVFKSIEEVRKYYFPEAVEKERKEREENDPGKFGTQVAKDILDQIRKELEKK